MRSKTSFFNPTVFRKNCTRFAPMWVLYGLVLIINVFTLYGRYGYTTRLYYFAVNYASEFHNFTAFANLLYALCVAQLLFGDLYSSRMCNALHAMPLRRECWFVTNMAAGLLFSLIPTAVVTLLTIPLLNGTVVAGAWKMALGWFLYSNLGFVCCFGMAAFCAMCVGNRFTMAAGYALLNCGALLAYWMVDNLYTPLLYGVITPTALSKLLTPFLQMTDYSFYEIAEDYAALYDQNGNFLTDVVVNYTFTDQWPRLFACAGVGLAFGAAALLLYRRRDLECAGEAVAFRPLVPVFQVLCTLSVAVGGYTMIYMFLGSTDFSVVILALGMVVGWFLGKMLLERSIRVFRLRNWPGLLLLCALVAASLVCTYFDVLGIENRIPDAQDVERVYFESIYTIGGYYSDEADIQQLRQLHALAVDDRAEDGDLYVEGADGEMQSYYHDLELDQRTAIQASEEKPEYTYVTTINLTYELKNGRTMARSYCIWVDHEAGALAESFLNDWDYITCANTYYDYDYGTSQKMLDQSLKTFRYMGLYAAGSQMFPTELNTRETAESFLEAVMADVEAGNMAQDPSFHRGCFKVTTQYYDYWEEQTYAVEYISVEITGENASWSISVYPDSENTVRWLQERGLLDTLDAEILPSDSSFYSFD